MRCRIGDLAVVIDAYHRCNLGTIVRIIAPHDGIGTLTITDAGHVRLVDADTAARTVLRPTASCSLSAACQRIRASPQLSRSYSGNWQVPRTQPQPESNLFAYSNCQSHPHGVAHLTGRGDLVQLAAPAFRRSPLNRRSK